MFSLGSEILIGILAGLNEQIFSLELACGLGTRILAASSMI
uniref:Uncharacterized protein n=1 Tax=Arundo donax TaxID=35708 RepID=A0A0A9G9S3_ARUDO